MPGGLSSTLCYHRIRRGGRLRLIASDPPALFCHIWSPFRRRLMILGLVNKMGPLLQTYWAHSLAGMWGAHQSFLHPPPTQWGRDEIRELYFWEPSPSLMCETATDKGLRRNRAIETSWSVCRVRDKGSLLNGLRSKPSSHRFPLSVSILNDSLPTISLVTTQVTWRTLGTQGKNTRRGNFSPIACFLVVVENMWNSQRYDKENVSSL